MVHFGTLAFKIASKHMVIRVCILLVLLVLQLYYIFDDSALVEVAVGGVSLSMYCVVCASRA